MKYNDNGEYKDIYVKAFDTLPMGTEVDYDGSVVPSGWTEIPYYSTDEIDTGMKWIDGKPIYRKVIENTMPSTLTYKTILINSNIENYVKIDGYIKRITDNGFLCIPAFYESIWNLNSFNGNIIVELKNIDYANKDIVLIIEYTKTTD